MSRLIDADKLMEEIRSYRMTVTGLRAGKGVLNECMIHFSEGILKIIDEQPTVNEWIPCSERLPEESGKYEVTASDAGRLISTQVKWQPKLKSWNLTGQMAYWKIIAWKPLPEPYRPNNCHGCFGAADNDCERCMDGNG